MAVLLPGVAVLLPWRMRGRGPVALAAEHGQRKRSIPGPWQAARGAECVALSTLDTLLARSLGARAANTDLGTACGRYFRVSVLAITDPGDSDIIKNLEGSTQ